MATYDNIMVKITQNRNYQGLQANKQEQIKALVKGYDDYVLNLTNATIDNFNKLKAEYDEKMSGKFRWGMLIDYPALFMHNIAKGFVNGLGQAITGIATMGLQLVNNLQQTFVEHDGRFGTDFKGYAEEFGRDLLYTVLDPITSMAETVVRGGMSIGNLVGITDDSQYNKDLNLAGQIFTDMRMDMLKPQGNQFTMPRGFMYDPHREEQDKQVLEDRYYDWTKSSISGVNTAGVWFRDKLAEPIGKIVGSVGTLGLGNIGEGYEARSEYEKVGQFFASSAESMGRMIPSIIATYTIGAGEAENAMQVAEMIGKIYFFSSTFGGAMQEAIEKGASINDAYTYAYSNALIETLAEEAFDVFGGVGFGKELPSNFLTAGISEGMEEVLSELVSSGIEHIIEDGEVSNADFYERATSAFIGGFFSGSVFSAFGSMMSRRTTAYKSHNLEREMTKLYEGQNRKQEGVTRTIDRVLNAYNSDNRLDNNLIQKGLRTEEQRLDAKKKMLESSQLASEIIYFNEQTQKFELTQIGNEVRNDVKSFLDGSQHGNALDADNLAISKNRDGGIVHDENVQIATVDAIDKLPTNKRNIVNEILNKVRNVAFVENLGFDGTMNSSNGFIYIDLSLASSEIVLKTTVHELVHKTKLTNESGFNKMTKLIGDPKVQQALIDAGITLLDANIENQYRQEYMKQTNGNVELTNQLILEEKVANFIEQTITSENVLSKVLKISPELMETLDLSTTKELVGVDKKLRKVEKLFIKYGKQATRFKKGSLIAAINRGMQQTTYLKIGDAIHKIDKNLTGFFNSDNELNLEASLNETHFTMGANDTLVERKYSEFSKRELTKFFELFDTTNLDTNNIDNIIDNMLIEYDNQVEYKEIIGTKYTFLWNLINSYPQIREALMPEIIERKNSIMESAKNNGHITNVDAISGLQQVSDAQSFRQIFALNWMISDPRYASSVSLYDTRTYQNEAKGMYIFNDGLGGFVVSKSKQFMSMRYRNENQSKYFYRTVFESNELSSVFNNGDTKISKDMVNYIINDLGTKNIIATNTKLESIYRDWGFSKQAVRYDYWNQVMSEWSNSYNNMVVHNSDINNASPIYVQLQLRKINENNYKQLQLDVINEFNPMRDDYHVGIRTLEDIKTFNEAILDDESFVYGDFSIEDAQNALEKGHVMVYSSRPIRKGDFISTSYNMAKDYAGSKEVYQRLVDLGEVAWINGDEGQFTGNLLGTEIRNEAIKQQSKVIIKSPLDKNFKEIYVANRLGEVATLLDKYEKQGYKTLVNGVEYSKLAENAGRQYIQNNYFSNMAVEEYLGYRSRGELSLPTNNIYQIDGKDVAYTRDMITLDGVRARHTHWTTDLIVRELNKKKILLTESEILKLRDLESKNELSRILQYRAMHHMGENVMFKPFYTLNEAYIRDFLDSGEFKYDVDANQLYLAPYTMEITDLNEVYNRKTRSYDLIPTKKIVQGYGAFLAQANQNAIVVDNLDGKSDFAFYVDYHFGRENHRQRLESENDGGIIKVGETAHLIGRNNTIDSDVIIHDIKISGMPINQMNLDYNGAMKISEILNINRTFKDINMRKISNKDIVRKTIVNTIDIKTESRFLHSHLVNSFNVYDKSSYLDSERARKQRYNEIDLKEIGKTTNGKKVAALLNSLKQQYANIALKNFNQQEIYNHIFSNVVQQLSIELAENFGEKTFINKNRLVDNLESVLAESMAYVDNVFIGNEVNMFDANNQEGYQYIRAIHFALRNLKNAKNLTEMNALVKKGYLSPFFDMLDVLVSLDVEDNNSIKLARDVIRKFQQATRSDSLNSMALDNSIAPIIRNVLEQNNTSIDNMAKFIGHNEIIIDDKGNKKGTKRVDGLLGKVNLFDSKSKWFLDMFGFGTIFSMGLENTTGNIITERIYQAQIKQLEVTNAFHDHFDKGGYLKANRDNVARLEKETSTINNLKYKSGNVVSIPNSQVMYLRNIVLREIIRNRMIDMGVREGQKSSHFRDGGFININDNQHNKLDKKRNRIEVEIVSLNDLFIELDNIIEQSPFMKSYNKKILEFFDIMYEYANIRNKDVSGFELTSDNITIQGLTDIQKQALVDGLGDNVNIDLLYVPMRLTDGGKSEINGVFNLNSIVDLGISDGMVMGITTSNATPLIDSINFVVPQYSRSVANYYGLFRVINDLNILFNKNVLQEDGSTTNFSTKVDALSPEIIPYYEELLRDISGYKVANDGVYQEFNRVMGTLKRNFYKASLGLNAKVILTQFSSMFTLGITHGDFTVKSHSGFMTKFIKNTLAPGSKTKAQYYIENSAIYKDRSRNATYAVGEARSDSFVGNKFNDFTEATMGGIGATDNMINRGFFITLVEMGYTNEQAMEITDRAISRYQSSSLAINKPAMLRTNHELLKVFTKFLGEPMKVISNLYESSKQMEFIRKFDKNFDAIKNSFAQDLEVKEQVLVDLNNKKTTLESQLAIASDPKVIQTLEKGLKQLINRDIPTQERVIELQKQNNQNVEQQIKKLINSKEHVRQVFAKRISGFIVSVSWQAVLGVIFQLLRGGLDDKEADEAIWVYLSKLYGKHMGNELFGYMPFGRDIYSSLVEGYDLDVVGELQSLSRLVTSSGNMFRDMINGGDFNYGRHFRNLALNLGQITGVPTRQIERWFTTPTKWFLNEANYVYRDITGQKVTNKELEKAVNNGDEKLIETIVRRQLTKKDVTLTSPVQSEFERLAKSGHNVNPSGVPNTFTIDGIEYKNDKAKFAAIYEKSNFVIEKIMRQASYKRLDDEHKAKLIKAIMNYYHSLAKQEVSGVKIFTKERTYNLNQAYQYFVGRIPYYMNMQNKKKKGT